jgi:PDZ domain-containing protein
MFNTIYEKVKKFIKENIKFLVSLILIVVLFSYELPVCIYTPGGTVDLSDRIKIDDGYKSSGSLSMSYVSMVKSSIPFVLLSYVIPDWDLQKEEDVTYDNLSLDETIKIDKLYMEEGINNAIIAAYKMADKSVEVKEEKLKVIYVEPNSKANLKINDEIISVDSINVNSIEEIQEIVKEKSVNDKILVKIKRDGKEKEVTSTITLIDDEPKIGIATISLKELETTPNVEVKTKSSESGSSGGLMTSLAIYNALTKEDITKGKNIVGTGTIDEDGNVGEIDGIKYKLIGASKKKADIFLCPEENYDEAIKVKKEKKLDIEIVKVSTLKEAIEYLESR